MPARVYAKTCPICGKALTPITDKGPDTAPWACFDDVRGWWPAELIPVSRAKWNSLTRSFENAPEVIVAANIDRAEARARGTSNTPDHARP